MPKNDSKLVLPTSNDIISALEKIVKAFEDSTQIDLIRQRWEEIKKLQNSKEILSTKRVQYTYKD